MPLPALRVLDMFPVDSDGRTFVCFRDPAGIVEEQVLLSPMAYFLAVQLDGSREIDDLVAICAEQFPGLAVRTEDVRDLVARLDEQGFLLSATFDALRTQKLGRYLAGNTRPAYFAGKSYPDDPAELRAFLDGMFTRHGGPGVKPSTNGAPAPLKGLIVPHIDFHRGGHSYAHGYGELLAGGKPDLALIFGVAHMAEPVPFILTRKAFETPLGTLDTDGGFLEALEAVCDWDPYEHELTHRTEHSVEFQAVMLAHLYGPDIKIVPILCSMFNEDPFGDTAEIAPGVDRFLDTCRDAIANYPGTVTVIAGADLAHVGKRFGDDYDIDDAVVQAVATRDHEDLAHVYRMEAKTFYASVMNDCNARKVCGLNCIYATVRTLEGRAAAARPLHYGYAHDPAGGIVSFASAVFE